MIRVWCMLRFHENKAPIYTRSRYLPPSKVMNAQVNNCVLGDGSILKAGAKISNSVLGVRSLVNEDVIIRDSVVMGNGKQLIKQLHFPYEVCTLAVILSFTPRLVI